MKIYVCCNNGVTAAVSERTKALIDARIQLTQEKGDREEVFVPYPHRIHSFSNSPYHKGWVNGNLMLLQWLTEKSGAEIVRESFYVPFSNGIEWQYRTEPERAEEEWRFRTSTDELLQDFGLM